MPTRCSTVRPFSRVDVEELLAVCLWFWSGCVRFVFIFLRAIGMRLWMTLILFCIVKKVFLN